MKKPFVALMLVSSTLSAIAQNPPSTRPTMPAANAPFALSTAPAPLVWTDSTGKTVGRVVDVNHVALATDHGTQIVRLSNNVSSSNPNVLLSSSKTWEPGHSYFDALNCSGTSYIEVKNDTTLAPMGSPRLAITRKVESVWELAISPVVNSTTILSNVGVRSEMASDGPLAGQCQNLPSQFIRARLVPIETTIPLDSFGTPPFYLK